MCRVRLVSRLNDEICKQTTRLTTAVWRFSQVEENEIFWSRMNRLKDLLSVATDSGLLRIRLHIKIFMVYIMCRSGVVVMLFYAHVLLARLCSMAFHRDLVSNVVSAWCVIFTRCFAFAKVDVQRHCQVRSLRVRVQRRNLQAERFLQEQRWRLLLEPWRMQKTIKCERKRDRLIGKAIRHYIYGLCSSSTLTSGGEFKSCGSTNMKQLNSDSATFLLRRQAYVYASTCSAVYDCADVPNQTATCRSICTQTSFYNKVQLMQSWWFSSDFGRRPVVHWLRTLEVNHQLLLQFTYVVILGVVCFLGVNTVPKGQ